MFKKNGEPFFKQIYFYLLQKKENTFKKLNFIAQNDELIYL